MKKIMTGNILKKIITVIIVLGFLIAGLNLLIFNNFKKQADSYGITNTVEQQHPFDFASNYQLQKIIADYEQSFARQSIQYTKILDS